MMSATNRFGFLTAESKIVKLCTMKFDRLDKPNVMGNLKSTLNKFF
jgi:hypothetical protein